MSAKWTFDNIPDLTGKRIVVTGGNSGLGFEAVKMFAAKGADVVLAARSMARGEAAKTQILAELPGGSIEVMALDLGDLASVRDFAEDFRAGFDRLDVLLNNAGVMWCPYAETKQGFELQMGVNHFGHFALTGLMLPLLKATPDARVVTVSSLGHRSGDLDPANPFLSRAEYKPTQAYYNSKLANLLFAYELQRRLSAAGLDVISFAAHPGGSATNLARHMQERWWFRLLTPLFYLVAQSAAQGTLPEVRAAVDPSAQGGQYWGPDGRGEMRGHPVLVGSIPASHDRTAAETLWAKSEDLTGVAYDFA